MTYYISHSGRRIDLTKITVDDICLDDIAHHLTKICRYGGALDLNKHYSVANHSIALYYYARDNGYNTDIQQAILMHDAAEAYLGDIVAGLKGLLPDYRQLETKVEHLLISKYKIERASATNKIVKELDTRILLDEAKAFVSQHYDHFTEQMPGVEPLGIKLYAEKDLHITKALFLQCCEQLGIKD